MKYIVEFEDEPCMYVDDVHFYKCIQAPWWGLSEKVIKYLTPYQPDAPDTNVGDITNSYGHESDLISRQAALDAIMGQPPEPHYPSWYAAQIEKLPAVQPDHTADVSKKVSISCGHENDLISRQAALKELAAYIHLIDKTMGKGFLTDDDCMEAAKSVLGEDELPAVQPDHVAVIGKKAEGGCISRQAAIAAITDELMPSTPLSAVIRAKNRLKELPSVQPDHNADSDKKVSISYGHESDLISRQAAIDSIAKQMPRSYTPDGSHPADEEIFRAQEVFADCIEALEILPSAQPEIIRCKDCKHRHVENMVWTCPFGLPGGENFFCGYGTEPYKGE